MKLTVPQSELFTSTAKATAMVSGYGAGKTRAAISRMIATKIEYPETDLLYCAPTYSLVRDILFPELCEMLADDGYEEGVDFIINRSPATSEIILNGCGRIICRTMDRPERIVGFKVGDAFLDEFDTLPMDKADLVWIKILARIRSKFSDNKKNQIFVTTTPEGFKSTYKMFEKEDRNDYRLIRASSMSNPHLPEDYVKTLELACNDSMANAYIHGQFVNLTSGTVYYAFSREKCNTRYVARPREQLHIGMDFNVNHMAAIVHILRDNVLYAVDEIIDLRDTPDMILEIKERYNGHPITIYPDSSGKSTSSKGSSLSDHSLLKDAGFKIRCKNTNPFVRDRVAAMNVGFDKHEYKVNVDKCPVFAECLEQQAYDKNGAPDKTSNLDHPLDAAGYCKNILMPLVMMRMQGKKLGGM